MKLGRKGWRRRVMGMPISLLTLLAVASLVAAAIYLMGPPSNQQNVSVGGQMTVTLAGLPTDLGYANTTSQLMTATVTIATNTYSGTQHVYPELWVGWPGSSLTNCVSNTGAGDWPQAFQPTIKDGPSGVTYWKDVNSFATVNGVASCAWYPAASDVPSVIQSVAGGATGATWTITIVLGTGLPANTIAFSTQLISGS